MDSLAAAKQSVSTMFLSPQQQAKYMEDMRKKEQMELARAVSAEKMKSMARAPMEDLQRTAVMKDLLTYK